MNNERIMIVQLSGNIVSKSATEIVMDCMGVGYGVMVSVNTSEKMPEPGNKAKLLTMLIPREDAVQLFGFYEDSERDAFKMLISISGVGPKIALGILSSLKVEELKEYILTGNLHALTKLPGIGKKTAERLHLELKDKIKKLITGDLSIFEPSLDLVRQEALAALMTLGYSRPIAEKAIRKVMAENSAADLTAEDFIKLSLKFAMK
jgi:holliday junction DNA helicase RuvA